MKILVVSDIHANGEALSSVLDAAYGGYDGLLCLGDIVGYGPDPVPCIRALRALEPKLAWCGIIAGNHEGALSGRVPEEWFSARARASVAYNRRTLGADELAWLSALPETASFGGASPLAIAVHGSPCDPLSGYLFGGDETFEALSYMADTDVNLCFCGHTHQAVIYSCGWGERLTRPVSGQVASVRAGPVIVNPGSVGFPRSFNVPVRADARSPGELYGVADEPPPLESFPAYYALWDTEAGTVVFREARYDRRNLEERIARLGLSAQ